MSTIIEPLLRDWLLHRLDATQVAALEERLFVEPPVAEQLIATRYDLLDDYARRRLGPDDRSRFEKFQLMTPIAHHRLRVAKALAKMPRRRRARYRPFALVGAIAAGIIVAVAVFSPALKKSAAPDAAITQENRAQLPTVALQAVAQRGAESTTIDLPQNRGRLRLQAEIDDASNASENRYALRVFDGQTRVFEVRSLAARTIGAIRFVETSLPTSALGPGHRRVELTSDEPTRAMRPIVWDLDTHEPKTPQQ